MGGVFKAPNPPSLSWLGEKWWLETSLWDADASPFIGQVMSLG